MTTFNTAPRWSTASKAGLAALLVVQFLIAYVIGTEQWLRNEALSVFPPIAITVAIPVLSFLAAYTLIPRFRQFVLSQDIRTLTMMQIWRVIGFVFLLLYSFSVLPGLFALPAGFGDVAVGITALYVVARMNREPDYVTSSGFLWFHFMGLFDFVVAVVTVGLAAGAFPGLISNGITSAPMDVWPLNIFPSFGVPAFIILHLTVLLKVRELRRTQNERLNTALQTA